MNFPKKNVTINKQTNVTPSELEIYFNYAEVTKCSDTNFIQLKLYELQK